MQKAFSAELYDYGWLEQRAREELPTRILLETLGRRLGMMSEVLGLRLLPRLRRLDGVYASGEDVGIPLALLLRLVGMHKPRLVMRLESLHYGKTPLKRRVYRAVARMASRRIDVFLCRTHAYETYLRSELGVAAEAIAYAPEPIDTRFFDKAQTRAERPDFVPKVPYLFSAGLELRDYDTLVEAVRGLDLQIVIAAGSPWSHSRYDLAGDSKPVNVLVSRFSQLEMRELYAHAEAVVVPLVPSLRSCGISVVNESTMLRCPVIATHTEGMATYIVSGETGVLVPPRDVPAMRSAIEAVVGKKEQLDPMTSRAYEQTARSAALENYVRFVYDALSPPERPGG
jgi:glycosyltransferase involved in cell wall biosynthesis